MKSIMAFTMVELLVAMVLSAIIIAIAYNVYNKTETSFRMAYDQYGKTNELLQLQTILNNDYNNAWQASFEDEQIKVERFDHSIVNYTIMNDKIIRQVNTVTDTFQLGAFETSVFYLFDKPPVLEKILLDVSVGQTMTYSLTAQVFYSNRVKFELSEMESINN
jgi:prepilin-type N-terminal cleavage/methylation domain-containing protein